MTRQQLDARLGTLRAEMARATEELGALRPRVQYLEQVLLRLDGAITVLQEFQAEQEACVEEGVWQKSS